MNIAPRYKKVIRDLTSNKSRTTLVILAIAVGVFAFGSVFITQVTLMDNIQSAYIASNPSTITLFLSDFDSNLVNWIKNQKGVKDASAKRSQTVKIILANGKEETLNLISVPDFSQMQLNLLKPQKGNWPPQKQELFLERSSLNNLNISIGEEVLIKTNDERERNLVLTGSVYDNSAFPYMFTNQMTGFISWDTLGYLGFPKRFNNLEIATLPEVKTLEDAEKLVFNIRENLRLRGVNINGSRVSKPNQHWATDNSKAFTAILSVIGVFSLILSGFLVVNTISALITQQKKQVGVMKALGATAKQIIWLYLAMVAVYGILALLIALPVGMFLGFMFLKLVSNFLNLEISSFYLPTSILLMQIGASLVVPIVAALIPVIYGTKTSIRSAISDFQSTRKIGLMENLLNKIKGLSRPVLISIRNVFRKKGRLVLTLGTLVTAGALFMAVINIRTGMYKEMDRILSMFDFQVSIGLDNDYLVDSTIKKIKETQFVTTVEGRTGLTAQRIKADGSKSGEFSISGLPFDTPFSHPVILTGRWLKNEDKNKIVLSSSFVRDNPDLSVGSDLYISTGTVKHHFEVVGIVAMSSDQKIAFSDFNTISNLKDKPKLASNYMIKTSPNNETTQNIVLNDVEDSLKRIGITINSKETKAMIISSAGSQFNFLIFFLLAMAVMVAVVGGLGLAGTMSLNVMERTREIGIMRSIGANDNVIQKMVLIEGLLVGIISWAIAIPLSLPLTYGFCYAVGSAFFGRTLVFAIVPLGMTIWFLIIIVIATFASIMPARSASKMSIGETLSYE